jgi:hypothetical protein
MIRVGIQRKRFLPQTFSSEFNKKRRTAFAILQCDRVGIQRKRFPPQTFSSEYLIKKGEQHLLFSIVTA